MNLEIYQLQHDLLTLGFNPGPLDGIAGSLTRGAAHDCADSLGLGDGKITPALMTEIHKRATAHAAQLSAVKLPPNYFDLSKNASQGWRQVKPWTDARGFRPWTLIDGVCLHQTGCPMGEDPQRWYSLKAHYGVTYSGKIYRVREENEFGWHAQGLSQTTIGIEIAGFFCGVEDDPKTRPGGPKEWNVQSVTDLQIEAVKDLMRYLAELVKSHGGKLKYCKAHRQSTDDRQPDPGSKVWQEIAIPMSGELGLTDGGAGWTSGKGMRIPEAWDARYKGVGY